MPFERPTPPQIRNRLMAEIEAALPGSDARTRRSVEGVLVRAMSVASFAMHEHLDWVSLQILVDTAEDEMLDRHGGIWGIERKAATAATGKVRFIGTDGMVIPAGLKLRRGDDARFSVDASVTIVGGIADVVVIADQPGAAGMTPIDGKLSLITPLPGINVQVVVIDNGSGSGLASGADTESNDSLRSRIVARIQAPPHGGAKHDYLSWALEMPGVTRAWVYPLYMGLGTVGVCFVMDNKGGTIVPSPAEVAAVQAHIDQVRPVTAQQVIVFAPIIDLTPLSIRLFPDNADNRAAVAASLADFFRREGEPGATLYLSRLREAISVAVGEDHHDLISPAGSIVAVGAHMPQLGAITWVA